MVYFMGIDVGSMTTKGVITEDGRLSASHIIPSQANYRLAAERLREELLARAGLAPADIAATVVTGYSNGNTPFSSREGSSLICCARGIHAVSPAVRTVIDIGEQSTQIIIISGEGRIINFAGSEKCASGSGRFLKIIANVLMVDLNDIGALSLRASNPITFTTGCAVFGESEAISRIAEGVPKEDIVAGAHKSLADKISTLIDKVGLEEECAVSGGGSLNAGLLKTIEEYLGIKLTVIPQPQLATALGAALIAGES